MTTSIELDAAWLQPGSTVPIDAVTTGRLVQAVRMLAAELERLHAADTHSCHFDCTRAGCVTERLRLEVERLRAQVAPAGWRETLQSIADSSTDAVARGFAKAALAASAQQEKNHD